MTTESWAILGVIAGVVCLCIYAVEAFRAWRRRKRLPKPDDPRLRNVEGVAFWKGLRGPPRSP